MQIYGRVVSAFQIVHTHPFSVLAGVELVGVTKYKNQAELCN